MVHEIEAIFKELCAKMRPDNDEDLQRGLEMLLHQCYEYNIYSLDHVPRIISVHVEKVLNSIFVKSNSTSQNSSSGQPSSSSSNNSNPTGALPIGPYLLQIESNLTQDLTKSQSLLELVNALKFWIDQIQKHSKINTMHSNNHHNTSTGVMVPLENLSGYLVDVHTVEVEIPGQYFMETLSTGYPLQQSQQISNHHQHQPLQFQEQYFDGNVGDDCDVREPFVEQHEKLQCFQPDVDLVRRNMVKCRRLTMRSHSGKLYPFLVTCVPASESTCYARSEDRVWSLMLHFNRVLDRYHHARRRALRIHTPIIIPLSQKIRLINERTQSYQSLEDVLHGHCEKSNELLDTYWKLIDSKIKDLMTSSNANGSIASNHEKIEQQAKLMVYQEMCDLHVPKDMLLKTMIKEARGSWNHLFQMRKRFITQLSLFSLIDEMINTRDVGIHKILISQDTGDLFRSDLRSDFNAQTGLLTRDPEHCVPFRLTPNMVNFCSPFGMEGPLLNNMSVAAHAFNKNKHHMRSLLNLFVRDELIAWQSIYSGAVSEKFSQDENLLKETVSLNVDGDILKRLNELAPPFVTHLPSASGQVVPGSPVVRMHNTQPSTSQNVSGQDGATPTANAVPLQAPQVGEEASVLNAKIIDLIHEAQKVDKLANMSPTWFPWV
ncbi:hypothetical protein AKO1_006867 [Acrasis kona]|uniref:PI3K/PI4K catalytic domain-containing protein n=1 Tax=Acrasis kona TaxID=1008807 RepID=A0AAW2YU45_9EUKA